MNLEGLQAFYCRPSWIKFCRKQSKWKAYSVGLTIMQKITAAIWCETYIVFYCCLFSCWCSKPAFLFIHLLHLLIPLEGTGCWSLFQQLKGKGGVHSGYFASLSQDQLAFYISQIRPWPWSVYPGCLSLWPSVCCPDKSQQARWC